ncbi:arachidonate 12- [Lynx pardinus]|uniref:Arachidonate 12 n=1 Tax=Lynx pardinus TaxID=191816 RepID=A0A485MLJ9_LYNPA|nr:arachidonate 12- [Lynx pardinus]
MRSRGPLGEDHEPGRESTQTPGRDRAHPDSGPEEEAVRIGHCSRRVLRPTRTRTVSAGTEKSWNPSTQTDCASEAKKARLAGDNALDVFQKHREKELKERRRLYCWATWKEGLPRTIAAERQDDLGLGLCSRSRPPRHQRSPVPASPRSSLRCPEARQPHGRAKLLTSQRFLPQPLDLDAGTDWNPDLGTSRMRAQGPWLQAGMTGAPLWDTQGSPGSFPACSLYSADEPHTAGNLHVTWAEVTQNSLRSKKRVWGVRRPFSCLIKSSFLKLLRLEGPNRQPGAGADVTDDAPPPQRRLPWTAAPDGGHQGGKRPGGRGPPGLAPHPRRRDPSVASLTPHPPPPQLLIPHIRYTLEINTRARSQLISEGGIFDKAVSTGGGGHVHLLRRAMAQLTYSSLCPPDDLAARGLLGIPSALYAHDALRLWEIIARYVQGIVRLFYHRDDVVRGDPELQAWCREITEVGLCQAQDRGFPASFQSQSQLCHFLTMCVFTCTAQHGAINQGQLDWYAWVPNAPCTMRMPPPTTKEDVKMATVMGSLPDIRQACLQMTITWHLGRRQPDMVPLGHHKEKYFSSPKAKAVLNQFQTDLENLEREITARNAQVDLPYDYLRPSRIENSVTI